MTEKTILPVTINYCQPKDCHEIADLGRSVWDDWATGETLPRQYIDVGQPVFVARNLEGKLVGYTYGSFDASGSSALVMSMTIHPDFRHQGVGTQLLGAMLMHLDRKNMARVITNIDPENAPSLGLFKKHGFVPRFKIPDYYEGATMVRLQRNHP